MLEAVNSVLQTAPLVRGNADQVSTVDSFAVNPDRVQKITQAPYVSPYFAVDVSNNKVVMEIRNPETGAVIQSYPSEAEAKTRNQDETQSAAGTLPRASSGGGGSGGGSGGVIAATGRQLAAFASAAGAGGSSGGNVTVFA